MRIGKKKHAIQNIRQINGAANSDGLTFLMMMTYKFSTQYLKTLTGKNFWWK